MKLSAQLADSELHARAARFGARLLEARLKLATAESCTGGWVAKVATEVPGSSGWFDCAFVAYSYDAKEAMLGVPRQTLEQHGAVSRETVIEMVRGALSRSRADLAVAITGIAGPTGGTRDKPVGTVWIACAQRDGACEARLFRFDGDRESVRCQAARTALDILLDRLRRVG